MLDRVEIALEGRLAIGVRAYVVVLGARVAADGFASCGRHGERRGERKHQGKQGGDGHRNGYDKMGCRMLLAQRIPLNPTNGLAVQEGSPTATRGVDTRTGTLEALVGETSVHQMVQPPDTSITAPLMYEASSEASHA